ncbi:hypothetical protein ELBR111191_01970 [Elizabethkingia bruuniana]
MFVSVLICVAKLYCTLKQKNDRYLSFFYDTHKNIIFFGDHISN